MVTSKAAPNKAPKTKGGMSKSASTVVQEIELCLDGFCSGTPSPGTARRRLPFHYQNSTSKSKGRSEYSHGGSKSGGSKSGKPTCCKGGVSALSTVYQGDVPATLYLPSSVAGEQAQNACDGTGSTVDDLETIAFADCERCFPTASNSLLPECTSSDLVSSIDVQPGDKVCLLSVDVFKTPSLDAKFSTDTTLLFRLDTDDTLYYLELHTSCSKPIYPPYAVSFDCAEDSLVVNLEQENVTGSYLEFVDGVSAKDSTLLFTECSANTSVATAAWMRPGSSKYSGSKHGANESPRCCKGGVTYLKVLLDGTQGAGLVTLDPSETAKYSDCVDTSANSKAHHKRRPAPSGDFAVHFIPCNDPCLDPFADSTCESATTTVAASPEDSLCLASYDSETNKVLFGVAMPTNVAVYFVPDQDQSSVYSAQVHMSCSKPVHPPFAQAFVDACGGDSVEPFDLTYSSTASPTHLAFLDGISRDYYEAAIGVGLDSLSSLYDITFDGCGCECTSAPGLASSSAPTPLAQSMSPTSIATTAAPSPASPGTASPTLAPTDAVVTPSPTTPPTLVQATPEPTFIPTMASFSTSNPTSSQAFVQTPTAEPTFTPTSEFGFDSPAPTAEPTFSPTSELNIMTESPTSRGFFNSRAPSAAVPPECEENCRLWVYYNCDVVDTDGTQVEANCIVPLPFDFGTRSLTLGDVEHAELEANAGTPDDQLRFHRQMTNVLENVLSMIE